MITNTPCPQLTAFKRLGKQVPRQVR